MVVREEAAGPRATYGAKGVVGGGPLFLVVLYEGAKHPKRRVGVGGALLGELEAEEAKGYCEALSVREVREALSYLIDLAAGLLAHLHWWSPVRSSFGCNERLGK